MSGERDERLLASVRRRRGEIVELVRFVHEHPELAHEEHENADRLVAALEPVAEVTRPFAELGTAFAATITGTEPGATVGIVAVYDAVGVPTPRGGYALDHSCGHAPIAAGVVGAALALAANRDGLAGRIVILGLPADELVSPKAISIGSGKALAVERGALDGLDAVLYAHPESHTGVWRRSKWMQLVELTLPGVVDPAEWALPFDRYRIDQVTASAEGTTVVLRVLGDTADELDERTASARARLAPQTWRPLGRTESLDAHPVVSAAAEAAIAAAGLEVEQPPAMPFSTDFGNVSRRVPAAMIGLGTPGGWAVHTPDGDRQFRSDAGDEVAVAIAAVLSLAADRVTRATL